VQEAVDLSLTDPGKPLAIEHRIVCPDGNDRVVYGRGEVTLDKDRRPVRMVGTIQDITSVKRTEKELQKAFDEIRQLKDQLEAENIYLRDEMELINKNNNIIGDSDPLKYVIYRVKQVAKAKTTVLLTGETGVGKGMIARLIHQKSDRRNKPFVQVNCAGLPSNLIESELFGREKGAFTGSTARQIGRFELADKGTIFMDEIGELPMELQAKLLKVIEDGAFERLGSPHTVNVDVRIIASTNRNLEEEIKNGRFRQDLFFRLNVFPITIPPLRQRKEDIPLLVTHLTNKFSKDFGKNIKRIPRKTIRLLEEYCWPGNVRELINVIERAVIVSMGSELRLAEKIDTETVCSPTENIVSDLETSASEPKCLIDVERDHILRTLQETGWRIEGPQGAANILQINPSTLRGRMRKLGIKKPGN
jgi:formate hydrogenlyase transcriptional activator